MLSFIIIRKCHYRILSGKSDTKLYRLYILKMKLNNYVKISVLFCYFLIHLCPYALLFLSNRGIKILNNEMSPNIQKYRKQLGVIMSDFFIFDVVYESFQYISMCLKLILFLSFMYRIYCMYNSQTCLFPVLL